MQRSGPRVTVLMSVFNDQGYLREAIESILNQTFRDFEFLIIDDGSTQPFDHILAACRDPRIVMIRHENMGLTRSLNRGLRSAAGTYIARMDADDVSLPTRLETQIGEFDRNPRLDLVGTFFDVVDADGRLLERKSLITDSIYRLWRLQFHNNYGHGSIMAKKQALLDVGGYDERLSYAQDYDLWSRLSERQNTNVIAEPLYQYRLVRDSNQASVRNYDAQLAAAVEISNRNLMACNPRLTEDQAAEVRALYWQFQYKEVPLHGYERVVETLAGFCRRFAVEGSERDALVAKVAQDLKEKVVDAPSITAAGKQELLNLVWTDFRCLFGEALIPAKTNGLS
ncbi:MAG: glycosyltransferase [Desulfomonile tiedjei]|nr:glycosyltransferase [Desulfomonile tiedjei]